MQPSGFQLSSDCEILTAPYVRLGSVVQALCRNSSNTLLVVRSGSDWSFVLDNIRLAGEPKDAPGRLDVMHQIVPFEFFVEKGIYHVDFESIWDTGNLVSIALLEAMKTNKLVRSLNLCVDSLEKPHLTAIVAGAGRISAPIRECKEKPQKPHISKGGPGGPRVLGESPGTAYKQGWSPLQSARKSPMDFI